MYNYASNHVSLPVIFPHRLNFSPSAAETFTFTENVVKINQSTLPSRRLQLRLPQNPFVGFPPMFQDYSCCCQLCFIVKYHRIAAILLCMVTVQISKESHFPYSSQSSEKEKPPGKPALDLV